MEPREKFRGLLNRKERWGLSFKGKLVAAVILTGTGLIVFLCVQPFLAVTHRVESRTLVVDGWVQEYAFDGAVKEFQGGSYDRVFAIGGPIMGQGGYISDSHTYASIAADVLKRKGIPAERLQMAPSHVMERDRTYGSAVALRDWMREHGVSVASMNVVTEGAHARRTWLLFQEVFGKDVKVGIISIPSPDYDPHRWWRYSEGVREIIDESVAYFYAKFLFWPSKQVDKE